MIQEQHTTTQNPGSIKETTLLLGDCLDKLKELEDNSIDSIVSDPPYGLAFMGKKWDYDVPSQEIWEECIRVLKPGGHLLSFAGSRTYHRMAVRIEDAGFEIRDQIMWIYGSGFPKSHNIIKQLEKQFICQYTKNAKTSNATTQLKHFQVELNAGKIGSVLTNVVIIQEEGVENKMEIGVEVGSSQTDTSIFVTKEDIEQSTILSLKNLLEENSKKEKKSTTITEIKQIIDLQIWNLLPNQNTLKSIETLHGTALKPSHEPIVMARKPIVGTVANNVLEYGVGGINIDGCRVGTDDKLGRIATPQKDKTSYSLHSETKEYNNSDIAGGRFPANIILDEEAGKILDEQSGDRKSSPFNHKLKTNNIYGNYNFDETNGGYNDNGGASRFFYCPKANKTDRNEGCDSLEDKGYSINQAHNSKTLEERYALKSKNNHPTVKPTDLMQYLIRLVTPKGGIVLDPFMGSGSTGKAAIKEGMIFVGIEREDEYYQIAKQRIGYEINKNEPKHNFW
jgi:DNA modification methylase